METGFEKLKRLTIEKKSHVVLGLDPDEKEIERELLQYGGLENYLIHLIRETHKYIVAIKPNLGFYESSPEKRAILARIMEFARNLGLVTILDAKRGDIANTEKQYANADLENFKPDIITLNPYLGAKDVIKPYLEQDAALCVYSLVATSNESGIEFQNLKSGGITNYQRQAILSRKVDSRRVGMVVGSTKPEAMENIRAIESEFYDDYAPVLAPGFGRQGGDLKFVEYAGENSVYPISSGLCNPNYLKGATPGEAAKKWRDDINERIYKHKTRSITQMVIDGMIESELIIVPESPDIVTWTLLKKGRDKLEAAGINIEGLPQSKKEEIFKISLKTNCLTESDFTNLFLDIRHIEDNPTARRLMAYLYSQKILESNVEYDKIFSIPDAATNIGALVADYLDKPSLRIRKVAVSTHDLFLGKINEGNRLFLVEDVGTSGKSIIEYLGKLRERGAVVENAIVFCKRTEDSVINCANKGVKLHYIIDMAGLKSHIMHSDYTSSDAKKMLLLR